jgi:hypothetical protein
MTSRTTGQLQLFKEALQRMPRDIHTYPMWENLHHVLVDFKGYMDEINKAVSGDGNGEDGVLKRVTNVESEVRLIRETTTATGKKIDDFIEAHQLSQLRAPVEAKTEQKTEPTITSKWWFVLGMALLAGLISPILLWLAIDIFPRIFSIPHP